MMGGETMSFQWDLRIFWLFNSSRQRVYGIIHYGDEGEREVGTIAWDRGSNAWEVTQWLDTEQNYKRPLGSFVNEDPLEGELLSIQLFKKNAAPMGA